MNRPDRFTAWLLARGKSKMQHLIAPAIDTAYLSFKKIHIDDSISKKSRRGRELLTKRNKKRIPWSHVYSGASAFYSLRNKRAHRLIIAAVKKCHCSACEEKSDEDFALSLLKCFKNQVAV